MKVFIGPYHNWVGPYQIAEALCFWTKRDQFNRKPPWVHNFGTWLATNKDGTDSWLSKFCQWVHSKKKRKVKIKLHPYDTWNMDSTLALIILPMLKQLKESKHGIGNIDPEDCPPELGVGFNREDHETWYSPERWNWFIDELIWTFSQFDPEFDEEEKYFTESDSPSDSFDRFKIDTEGLNAHNKRIDNGLRLFGKYYRTLWD